MVRSLGLAAALAWSNVAMAQTAISVSDSTGWTAWVNGAGSMISDASGDQQTGQTTDDFVGDSTYAAFQQKAGTIGGANYILWRARFDSFSAADKFGGNGGNLGLGIDLDGNGSVDIIMMMTEGSGNVNNRSRTLTFGTPGAGANTGPSTTTWSFPTQTAIDLTVNTTYDLVATTDGYNFNGSQDSWLTFGISFTNLQTAIQTYAPSSFSSYTVDYNSKMSFIAFTSTQNNSLNQDLAGATKNALTNGTAENLSSFSDLGAFTPMIGADGRVPEPATYMQIGVFALAAGLMIWRRHHQKMAQG